MNDINNFNEDRSSPDPINSQYVKKNNNSNFSIKKNNTKLDASLKCLAVILSIFLVIWSISMVFNLVSQMQGEGEVVTNDSKGVISVNDTSYVYTTPDTASVNIGVKDSGKNMDQVIKEHDLKVNNIKNYLIQEGILEKDVQVIKYNIQPEYQKTKVGVDLNQFPDGRIVIDKYSIETDIVISTSDINNIGKYIQRALDEGASTVSDPIFNVENKEVYIKEAREKAIKNAYQDAIEIAQKLGVSLGDIQNYNEYVDKFLLDENDLNEKEKLKINVDITYTIK